MYVHEDNIETKIGGNYNGLEEKLLAFEKKGSSSTCVGGFATLF